MPIPLQGFAGGSIPARSRTVNSERTVNLYLEATDGTPKRNPVLYVRPAAIPWTYVAPGPVRALFFQDDRFRAVSGGFYYDIARSRNVTTLGQVRNDSRQAFIASNGTGGFQEMIVSGGLGYIYNFQTGVFQQITDSNFETPITFCAYIDTYFAALQGHSNQFQTSQPLDGLVWDGLDKAQASLTSDKKLAMAVYDRKLVFYGSQATEPWQNDPSSSPPFAPYNGIVVYHGISAPYSVAMLDNTNYWLGQDPAGTAIVWRWNGWTPERVSNNALEFYLQSLSRLDNAIGFALEMSGHAWYGLYLPAAETTWMYDVAANTWAEWAIWDDDLMTFRPFVIACQASGWGMQFVGSRTNGTIYRLSFDEYTDSIVTVGGL